jgi:hypothetical protein
MIHGDEPYRRALRTLADSAAGEPLLSGSDVRALAERRRRRWVVGVPAVALSGLLVGGTAFAMGGAYRAAPRPAVPRTASASASASVTAGAPHAHAVRPRGAAAGGGAASRHSGDHAAPAGRTPASRTVPSGPVAAASCVAARTGETLESLRVLALPAGLTSSGIGTVVFAVPLSCVHGRLLPSGSGQWLPVAPDAVVTTTAPVSTGSTASSSTLQKLAAGLTRHPDQLFGVRRDSTGRMVRLDQVYQG